MSDYAVLFPGQGSQHKNMLEGYKHNDIFNQSIDKSSNILGYNINVIVQDESKLNDTLYTQPIMVATSIAIWDVWLSKMDKTPLYAACLLYTSPSPRD